MCGGSRNFSIWPSALKFPNGIALGGVAPKFFFGPHNINFNLMISPIKYILFPPHKVESVIPP